MRQIAEKAGVHYTTVSLAIRKHPRIPAATRDRILKIADEMGYVEDAHLSALNQYRINKRVGKGQVKAALAWINVAESAAYIKEHKYIRSYFRGAEERAKALGYNLEVISLSAGGISPARMVQILNARSIRGVLLGPVERGHREIVAALQQIDWAPYAVTAFGYSSREIACNRVTVDHYTAARMTVWEFAKRGYMRPGILLDENSNLRLNRLWQAGFLAGCEDMYGKQTVPPCLVSSGENLLSRFENWYESFEPDAIATQMSLRVEAYFHKFGLQIPEDVGIVHLEDSDRNFAMINQNDQEIGRTAINLVVGALHRNEFGLPPHPQTTLVPPIWENGYSVRAPSRQA